jgi:hypothetical protein
MDKTITQNPVAGQVFVAEIATGEKPAVKAHEHGKGAEHVKGEPSEIQGDENDPARKKMEVLKEGLNAEEKKAAHHKMKRMKGARHHFKGPEEEVPPQPQDPDAEGELNLLETAPATQEPLTRPLVSTNPTPREITQATGSEDVQLERLLDAVRDGYFDQDSFSTMNDFIEESRSLRSEWKKSKDPELLRMLVNRRAEFEDMYMYHKYAEYRNQPVTGEAQTGNRQELGTDKVFDSVRSGYLGTREAMDALREG